MRPAPNKEYGIVLDNAGLWLDHGLSYIDRDWSLEGIPKTKRKPGLENIVTIDEHEQIREIKRPFEATGLELIALTEELERLLVYESYIRNAKAKGHKISSVAFKYSEYLISKKKNYSELEIKYCHERLNKEGCNYKVGFWYYRWDDVDKSLKIV